MAEKPDKEPKGDLVPRKISESIPDEGKPISIGEWYWVKEGKEPEFFGCVVQVGSNFVEIENAYGSSTRVHFDKFDKTCRRELDPEKVIRGRVAHYQGVVQEKLGEIKKVTARLGLTPQLNIEQQHTPESSKALSVLSETDNVKHYEKALIKAQKEELPKLFKEVEEAHKQLATWMQAQAMPMKAMAENMHGCIGQIEDRVFNVSLYAGLTEQVTEISKGAPAAVTEKLHILQRLLYMDEECLANYRHGGMDFKGIGKFDAWLVKPENRDRVLPFPRSMVAFRVRRAEKERDWGGSLKQAFVNVEMAELDKATFLYIRNGERLYRMNCDLEFGELIFPGRHEMDLSEPMMAKTFVNSIEEIIPKREYDERLKEHEEGVRKYEEWRKTHPKKSWIENPYRDHGWSHDFGRWQPFNKSSVYYDDIKEEIENRVKYYNRIALIVQGLYDRSEVLHPHPPIQLWTPEGFAAAVELVYDGSNILSYGEAPNFEAYREACNAALEEGSITIGQDDFWQEKEAEKETKRLDNDWRVKSDYRPTRFKPYGNPGPGYLAKVARWWKASKRASYEWDRKRIRDTYSEFGGDPISCSVTVQAEKLFNVSAYKPGDFKRFFADPRTRAQYLKWAPALIAAEEYHAGNMQVGPKHED